MKNLRLFFLLVFSTLLFLSSVSALPSSQKGPLTVAESSNFTSTSRYDDVMKFIKELQHQSSLIRVETLCRSYEGRTTPLLVLGSPVPASPHILKYDRRAVVYIQSNIHAGEVEGKEASLMLARDIILKDNPPFLDTMVILIAPVFNADGNDKISPESRRNQAGPVNGVGVRYNGQNLDLNRDSMKLESPELQGLVQNVLMRWDPLLLVDCHTTNGSYHEEPVTYSWPLNPNGGISIIEYMREKMLPRIQADLRTKYKTFSIPYGNFMDFKNPEKGWRTLSHHPRFVTNYTGLRNRLAILNENYAYANYKTRVLGCYHFLITILEYCYSHKDEIIQLVTEADRNTIQKGLNPTEDDSFAVEFDITPLKEKVTIRGWEMEVMPSERRWPRIRKTDIKRVFTLPYYADFIPKKTVPFPFGYLLSHTIPEIIEKLLQHGITVEKLIEPANLEVESFGLKEIKGSERIYQGHRLNSVKGEYVVEQRKFPEGTIFICTAQPLGNLAAYLLEPESDDGLLVWNFFDRYLVSQWRGDPGAYPVYKLLKPAKLSRETIR
ncbi:MAG: M14 family metallopeptidase [Candidatus Aminicenantaceae bacterium]